MLTAGSRWSRDPWHPADQRHDRLTESARPAPFFAASRSTEPLFATCSYPAPRWVAPRSAAPRRAGQPVNFIVRFAEQCDCGRAPRDGNKCASRRAMNYTTERGTVRARRDLVMEKTGED